MQKHIKTLLEIPKEIYYLLRDILWVGYDPVRIVTIKNPVSQELYFETHIQWMKKARNRILIFGYDPFIERSESIEEITKAVNGQDYGRLRNVDVSAIIPISQNYAKLERLANESNFNLLRTPRDLNIGFIVYDTRRAITWDSTKPTDYPPEAETGAYYRRRYENDCLPQQLAEVFNEHVNKVINKDKVGKEPLSILRL